eukprot:842290-Lingulodinium_polyedra.AAC.1
MSTVPAAPAVLELRCWFGVRMGWRSSHDCIDASGTAFLRCTGPPEPSFSECSALEEPLAEGQDPSSAPGEHEADERQDAHPAPLTAAPGAPAAPGVVATSPAHASASPGDTGTAGPGAAGEEIGEPDRPPLAELLVGLEEEPGPLLGARPARSAAELPPAPRQPVGPA